MWGTAQSGVPRFKLADPWRDEAMLLEARDAARALAAEDPQLLRAEHAPLLAALRADYREPLDIALGG